MAILLDTVDQKHSFCTRGHGQYGISAWSCRHNCPLTHFNGVAYSQTGCNCYFHMLYTSGILLFVLH